MTDRDRERRSLSSLRAMLYPPEPLTSVERLLETHAMETAREWQDTSAWGLLLLGPVGRGKSVAAAWLWDRLRAEAFEEAQGPGRFLPVRDVLWLRARVLQRLAWQDRCVVLGVCTGAYGLVVDEMGAEDPRTSEALSDVLEERGDRQERTIMTTNLGPGEFVKRYGDRLVSRLRAGGLENGHARWAVQVRGEDLRGR